MMEKPQGGILAMYIAAIITILSVGVLHLISTASASFKKFLTLHEGVGSLSGKVFFAYGLGVIVFIVAFALLKNKQHVNHFLWLFSLLVALLLGTLFTYTPFVEAVLQIAILSAGLASFCARGHDVYMFFESLLLVFHFLGLASLVGGLLVQIRHKDRIVNRAMIDGAFTQLATGLALAWLNISEISYLKVTIKLLLVLIIVSLLLFFRRENLPRQMFFLVLFLSLAEIVIAVFWL